MDIADEIKSAMPALMARVREEAMRDAERTAIYAAQQVITAEAKNWAAEVLAPELRAGLEAMKPEMLIECEKLARGIADALTASMIEAATKNLGSSWNRKKVFEALFD
jgi:hypothetical protein